VTTRSLAVWTVGIAMAACTPAVRRSHVAPVPGESAASTTAPASVLQRPRHKGGVDLSTGLYGREDDDLVVNTPMPIVLRRTYNSGDTSRERVFTYDRDSLSNGISGATMSCVGETVRITRSPLLRAAKVSRLPKRRASRVGPEQGVDSYV